MEKIIRYDGVRNEVVIFRNKNERKIHVMHTMRRRKSNGLVGSTV